ncbi:Flp pilus assembly protein TadG [Silvibacterium bohemicum]|uniref:Flp pilus assembly protein TadG n=1 Tax=Silvibacterium bohemicum TaxID=1577686 RepID=A0A841JN30_9BACT|nr:TadE/TadG family type IV pilus assembly protein [Silvibacterium bohemicum]MBB6142653.1 Flp pilus assembly protein TadG [Silvibacterium bohemicum]
MGVTLEDNAGAVAAFPATSRFMSLKRNESGSELVEFALALSVVLACVFGIIDGSRAVFAEHYVVNAAREATRYAMVRGSSWNGTACTTPATFSCTATSAQVTSFVNSNIPPGIMSSKVGVVTTWPGTTSTGAACDTVNGTDSPTCVVSVQVTYAFAFSLPFLPQSAINFSSTSTSTIFQ